MEVVFFLRDYWQFISTGILVLFSIVLMIVKRKPITEIVDPAITHKIVDFVLCAENQFGAGHGKEKLDFVLSKIKEIRPDNFDGLRSLYTTIIEYVLSTPQKKESSYEKVK